MHPVEITLECPTCNGYGEMPAKRTTEFDAASNANDAAWNALNAAMSEVDNLDYDPFGPTLVRADSEVGRAIAKLEDAKKAAKITSAKVGAIIENGTSHLPPEVCPRCSGTGKVTTPVRLDTALTWIVAELARMDKEQTGGEPNAERIFKALEMRLDPFPTEGE